ncbi:MAG: Gfo/Idh/MocA family oxidoreductase [Phycisphaeraceae bacterium]|nr:Gfo/Idh/MocA family oxidoreductase [Phycisphaeraceae bacterium]MCW5754550.1 Gfo/Idh/MocA family oxidoreductase [Phycisphaeraceae bacterium]
MTHPVSRRSFVASAAAAGLAAPGLAAHRLQSPANGRDILRVGLIGCGGRGTGAAVQALRADSRTVLVAMADLFEDRLRSSLSGITEAMEDQAERQVRVEPNAMHVGFEAFQRVIDSDVDVVLLATTPNFRPMHIEAAVAAGKHVFAEKPMAVDGPGVRKVIAAAAEAKRRRLAMVSGFCWRYGNAERAVFAQINSGAIGKVMAAHTTYHTGTLSPRPRRPEWSDMEWQMRNWWHFTWISGDHIVEQACHSIDRLSWAMGDVDPVRCVSLGGRAARQGPESGHVYDHFAVIYEYPDGRRGFHTCRQIDRCPSDNTDYIFGTQGRAVVNGWTPQHELFDLDGRSMWTYSGPRRDMYQNEHDAMFASIRTGNPINDGEFMMRSTLMAIMGRMAAYTGQTITWEQALNSKEDLTPERLHFGEMSVAPVAVPGVTRFF